MKKNIQINLFGTLYNIDDDAYALLERYLESMKQYFQSQECGAEIADDIEHRVAELLWEKKESGMEAVNIETIKEIIGKIGNAKEINGDEDEANDDGDYTEVEVEPQAQNVFGKLQGKRLFRNPNDKVIAGVCSGLAQYLDLKDPAIMRVAFVVIAFLLSWLGSWAWLDGIGLFSLWTMPITYLLLLIIMPEAKTAEDMLRMNGQEVTPETINEQIINESDAAAAGQQSVQSGNGCLSILLKLALFILALPFLLIILLIVVVFVFVCVAIIGGTATMFPFFAEGTAGWIPEYFNNHGGLMIVGCLSALCFFAIPIYVILHMIRGKKGFSVLSIIFLLLFWILSIASMWVSFTSFGMTVQKSIDDWQVPVPAGITVDTLDTPDIEPIDTAEAEPGVLVDDVAIDKKSN